jgi:hypothetical protein
MIEVVDRKMQIETAADGITAFLDEHHIDWRIGASVLLNLAACAARSHDVTEDDFMYFAHRAWHFSVKGEEE